MIVGRLLEWALILVAKALLPVLQLLPLRTVARLGRGGGGLAWLLDARHRRVALDNLERCFGAELSVDQRRALARENFRRIGEGYACGIRTSLMTWEKLAPHLEFAHFDRVHAATARQPDRSVIIAIGHFGNFEVFTWIKVAFPGRQLATTYRGLRQETATRALLRIRERSGCLFFERRREAAALRRALRTQPLLLGLLADQHDGTGVRVPFFGQEAGTSVAPALLALRYGCPLFTAFCFRTGLAQWRLEVGEEIPTHEVTGERRSLEAIATDLNRSFEAAVRRDPANWFWVHRRWKPARSPRKHP